jgi:hypothetical protein
VPARPKFPSPEVQLRAILADARRRGIGFDEAWFFALGAPSVAEKGVRLPHATEQRRPWLDAFDATREEWRAAFEGRDTALSVALREIEARSLPDSSRQARVASLTGGITDDAARLAQAPVGLFCGRSRRRTSGELAAWPETREIAA